MAEPTVCCVMLTRDRPEMAARAVKCWNEQTFDKFKCRLLVYDTGYTQFLLSADALGVKCRFSDGHTGMLYQRGVVTDSIGVSRNKANAYADSSHYGFRPHDIIIHWDDDDWSHPNRIAEQVALLQLSGAECVGYREMLFWRHTCAPWDTVHCRCGNQYARSGSPCPKCHTYADNGEAWLYTNGDPRYCLGTSFCYWRSAWEKRPFPDLMRREDEEWRKGVKSVGYPSFGPPIELTPDVVPPEHDGYAPRMIATIHGGNTAGYTQATLENSINWKRLPEWDERVRKIMETA